jgi:hypothetical protein
MRKFNEWLKLFERNKNNKITRNNFSSKDSDYNKHNIFTKNIIDLKKDLTPFNSN